MKFYWEDELIKDTKNSSRTKFEKLVFVPNLMMFVENNKDTIKFDTGVDSKGHQKLFIKKTAGRKVYLSAESSKLSTKWKQIDGIETKQQLEWWFEKCSMGGNRYSYNDMNYNISKLAYDWAKKYFTYGNNCLLKPSSQLCANDKDLYHGFSCCYFNGYSFNECDPNTIYDNVYCYDFKSNHSSIMFYEEFPVSFKRLDKTEEEANQLFKEILKNKSHFFGEFAFYLEKDDPYLHRWNDKEKGKKMYDTTFENRIQGFFNDVDFEFLNRLCKIEKYYCYKIWKVETKPLKPRLRYVIKELFLLKEQSEKGSMERTLYKQALEKIYGNTISRRVYEEHYEWNEEEVNKVKEEISWEQIKKKLEKNKYLEYSIGIWVCSYARLNLLLIKQAIGKNAIYGDIDSIKFVGEKGLKVIEIVEKKRKEKLKRFLEDDRNSFEGIDYLCQKHLRDKVDENFNLGKLAFEYKANHFRALDLKWYVSETDNDLDVKCSGALPELVKEYLLSLENPVKGFTKKFPKNVKPYKRLGRNKENKLYFYYAGTSIVEEETYGG